MNEPLKDELLPDYIKRILSETNNTYTTLQIVDNYKKYNTNHIWLHA
jgi:hypothetical protein